MWKQKLLEFQINSVFSQRIRFNTKRKQICRDILDLKVDCE